MAPSRLARLIGLVFVPVGVAVSTRAPDRIDEQPGDEKAITLTLRRRFAVGGASDDSFTPSVLFAKDIGTDGRKNLYALDRSNNQVHVFDAKGTRLSVIGKRGRGPGELFEPSLIGLSADGSLIVVDNGKRMLVRFGPNGKPLSEQTTRGLGIVQQILSARGGSIVVLATVRDSDMVLRVAGERIERLAVTPPAPMKEIKAFSRCGLAGHSAAPLLSPLLLASGNGNFVVTNQNSAFGLTIHADGAKQRLLQRSRASERLSPKEARRILGDSQLVFVASRRCAVPTDLVVAEAGIATLVPPYSRIIVDAVDNIWALRKTANDAEQFVDVYSSSTGYRGTASIGKVNPVAFLADGAVVSLEKNADDAPVIVVYNVGKH